MTIKMNGLCILCLVMLIRMDLSGASQPATPEDVTQRLDELESKQRNSDGEIFHLKEITKKQATLIEWQAEEIRKLTNEASIQKDILREVLNYARETSEELENVKSTIPSENYIKEVVRANTEPTMNSLGNCEGCNNHNKNAVRQVSPDRAAFTAYNDAGMLPQPGEVITFNQIITNEGGAYDPDTGMFTCPADGLYLFTITVGEVGVNFVWADLMVRGVAMVEAAAETFHDGQDLQGAGTAVLRLTAGDLVWVAAAKLTGQHIPSGGRLTTFTGVYLHD